MNTTSTTAIGLSAVALVIILALTPLTGMPIWATVILGLFLLTEVAALWATARKQP